MSAHSAEAPTCRRMRLEPALSETVNERLTQVVFDAVFGIRVELFCTVTPLTIRLPDVVAVEPPLLYRKVMV
jgi:hypothetical protein